MKTPKVLIAHPMYAHVEPQAVASFTSFLMGNIGKHAVNVFQTVDMYIDNARNTAVKYALNEVSGVDLPGLTHVLFVDSDMILPVDGLDRLIECDKPVVGGLYFGKVPPFGPVAFDLTPDYHRVELGAADELQRVDVLGMGFTLVETAVLRDMKEEYDDEFWFSAGHGVGEDVWFFKRLGEMGVKSYLNPQVRCGHIAALRVDFDAYNNARKHLLREKGKEKHEERSGAEASGWNGSEHLQEQ